MAETSITCSLQTSGQFAGKYVGTASVDGPFAIHVEKGIGTVKVYMKTAGTNYAPKQTYYTTVSVIDDDFNIKFAKSVKIVCDTKPSECILITSES